MEASANNNAPAVEATESAVTAPTSAKRPYPSSSTADASAKGASDWLEHRTQDGRVYFYNSVTRKTSWTRPDADPNTIAEDAPEASSNKRLRTSPATIAPEQTVRSRAYTGPAAKARRSGGGGGAVVRRPRDPDGKPLTDRACEIYFLKRAEIRRKNGLVNDDPMTAEVRPNAPFWERTDAFHALLSECGTTSDTTWMEVMSRGAGDARYILLKTYGARKDAWLKYRQKKEKADRRAQVVKVRSTAEELLALMEDTFEVEDVHVLTLDRCDVTRVRVFEAEAKFRAMKDPCRAALVKTFFAARARRGALEIEKKRTNILSQMHSALKQKIDPALLPVQRDVKNSDSMGVSENAKDGADADTKNDDGSSDVVQYFSERTSYRELERFLGGLDGADVVNGDDLADVIRFWRRHVDMLSEEKRVREREVRKKMEKENRSQFRSGILGMLLEGRLPFTARWKDVSEEVAKEEFAKTESQLAARPMVLFEDGMQLFEKRVERCRDEFKQLLKDNTVEVNNETTVESLKLGEGLKQFCNGVEDSVAQALLVDRQRKENKRRLKDRERLVGEFDSFLRNNDMPAEETFDAMVENWEKANGAYKELVALNGLDVIKRKFEDFSRWRKAKEERKLKRKSEMDGDGDGLPGVHPRMKRARVSGGRGVVGVVAREEENGWDAVVSEKVEMTEEEKMAEKERRKREILEAHELETSVAHPL